MKKTIFQDFNTSNFSTINTWKITPNQSNEIISDCGLNHLVGGYLKFRNSDKIFISKSLTLIPNHFQVQISLLFLKIDGTCNYTIILDGVKSSSYYVTENNGTNNLCGTYRYEREHFINETFSHTKSDLTLQIHASGGIKGFWGFNNVKIDIITCHSDCLTCSG